MQRADVRRSASGAGAPTGKFAHSSAQTIVLEVAELTASVPLGDEVAAHLLKIDTLLRTMFEVCQEATDDHGFFARTGDYLRDRMMRVMSLIDLADDEVARMNRLVGVMQ